MSSHHLILLHSKLQAEEFRNFSHRKLTFRQYTSGYRYFFIQVQIIGQPELNTKCNTETLQQAQSIRKTRFLRSLTRDYWRWRVRMRKFFWSNQWEERRYWCESLHGAIIVVRLKSVLSSSTQNFGKYCATWRWFLLLRGQAHEWRFDLISGTNHLMALGELFIRTQITWRI